jgi:hypothetical protein
LKGQTGSAARARRRSRSPCKGGSQARRYCLCLNPTARLRRCVAVAAVGSGQGALQRRRGTSRTRDSIRRGRGDASAHASDQGGRPRPDDRRVGCRYVAHVARPGRAPRRMANHGPRTRHAGLEVGLGRAAPASASATSARRCGTPRAWRIGRRVANHAKPLTARIAWRRAAAGAPSPRRSPRPGTGDLIQRSAAL